MNFNLISPTGNGNDYTINFRDPITIDENSELRMNWVELQRKGKVKLNNVNTITLTSNSCLPNILPDGLTNNEVVLTATIPPGLYEFSELQDKITEEINTSCENENKFIDVVRDTPQNHYQASDIVDSITGQIKNDGVIGINLSPGGFQDFAVDSLGIDEDNSHDSTQVDSSGDNVYYTTTNNNGTYDNYGNTDRHFDFWRGNCPGNTQKFNSVAEFTSILTPDAQTGRIGFGLTGHEYTVGINTPPTRTNGDNPPVIKNTVPACFLWFDIGGSTGDIVIYMAQNSGGNTIDTWTNQNQEITNMVVIDRIPVATSGIDTGSQYKFLFSMEPDDILSDTPNWVWKFASYQRGKYIELYNSSPIRRNLPFALNVATDGAITYNDENSVDSQIPFIFQCAVTNADNGWENVGYTVIDKNLTEASEPFSYVARYDVSVSEELAGIFGLSTAGSIGLVSNLYPNACQEEARVVDSKLDFNWRSKNYSIFINLPTNNYKNVAEKRDGGFKKSILANLPSPFTTGTIIESEGTDSGEVISIYQPYQPVISKLKNNAIQTNNISIKIVDMDSEEPAVDVDRSVINFTIMGGEK